MYLANSFTAAPVVHGSAESLTIAYAQPTQSLDPTLFDSVTRNRLVNIYEGLVRTDRNLKIEPAVAVSWGLVNPTTWEFILRPNVKFHNGLNVRVADVISSIDLARNGDQSQLKNLLSTISDVQKVDDSTLRITTRVPDPLLLNKLAVTYVFPQDYANFDQPIGTGPYQFVSLDNSNQMTLKSFDGYWGNQPFYSKVVLKTIENRDDRMAALKNGSVDLLADVPPPEGCTLDTLQTSSCLSIPNVEIKTIPSLQVSFLMFNTNSGVFKDKSLRLALAYALDRNEFVKIAGGFANPIQQFVSSGIFGFDPDIQGYGFDMDKAKAIADPIVSDSFERMEINLDYAVGNDVIAQYVQTQLGALGIDVDLNPLSPDDFQKKLQTGTSDFYFLGWRSELGDANDFLQTVVHSRDASGLSGLFNGTNYSNKDVDTLIDKSQQDLNEKNRLKEMQDAMKILVNDDIAGIPLFETETLYAYQNKIKFEPRVDGYVYAAEIN
jgi:peptide/nickel transport system substrate-binding protein